MQRSTDTKGFIVAKIYWQISVKNQLYPWSFLNKQRQSDHDVTTNLA